MGVSIGRDICNFKLLFYANFEVLALFRGICSYYVFYFSTILDYDHLNERVFLI